MIVDSTALPEQVADDVVTSAFLSAGQRCSALRLLFVQEEIADRVIAMIAGAMDELVHWRSVVGCNRCRSGHHRSGGHRSACSYRSHAQCCAPSEIVSARSDPCPRHFRRADYDRTIQPPAAAQRRVRSDPARVSLRGPATRTSADVHSRLRFRAHAGRADAYRRAYGGKSSPARQSAIPMSIAT